MDKTDRDFEKQVLSVIREYEMIRPGEKIVAGVSGGADSVCLLLLLSGLRDKLDCEITAVHVEHGLRGETAMRDAAFTEALCTKLQVPFSLVHVKADEEAVKRGMSVEEAGRALRYEAFEAVCRETGAVRIATAHHREDQAETVLLNLSRGTGLAGIGGIRPVTERCIRPLLFSSRDGIEHYLHVRGQNWMTDETNAEDLYTRNRVRLQVLPLLGEAVNSRAAAHISQAALDAQRADSFLERLARQKMDGQIHSLAGGDGYPERLYIPVSLLRGEEQLLQEYILRLALGDMRGGMALKDISRIHIRDLCHLARQGGGRSIDLPAGMRAVREKEDLVLYREPLPVRTDQDKMQQYPAFGGLLQDSLQDGACAVKEFQIGKAHLTVRTRICKTGEVPQPVPEKRYTKWLAYDTMSGDLCLRTRQTGDYLVINAAGGRRSLKDYLIDRKVPRSIRDEVPVIAQGSHILWVVGGRISEAAKIGPCSEGVLEVTVSGADDI